MAYTGKTPVNFVDVTQSQSMNVTDDLTVGGAFTSTGIDDNATSNAVTVDSSGNVGIGTSSPIKTLHINENDSEAVILIQSSDTGTAGLYMGDQSDSIVGGIVYDNNTDTLQLRSSNNHTAVTINSSEQVGIGTTSPDIYGVDNADNLVIGQGDGNNGITISSFGTSNGTLAFSDTTNATVGRGFVDYDHNIDAMSFGTLSTERLRIDSAGNVYQNLGGTSERGYRVDAGSDDFTYVYGRNGADTSPVFYAQVGNVARAEIEADGSFHSAVNSYGGFSDQKYKENITLSGSQWDDIKAIQVKKYSWIHDNLDAPNQIGVVAQDLEASGMSGLVTNHTKKEFDADGNENVVNDEDGNPITYKSVKYSILYMKAIKALQEAMDKIETLETKVAALENA